MNHIFSLITIFKPYSTNANADLGGFAGASQYGTTQTTTTTTSYTTSTGPIMGTTNVLEPIVNTSTSAVMGSTNVLEPIVNTSVNSPIIAGELPTLNDQLVSNP